jgi:hypothetical protein
MRRIAVLVALTGATMLLAAGTAGANTYSTTGPTDASGPSPFAPGCGGPGEGFSAPGEVPGVNFLNTEVEPWFEVNPTDSQNLVGFWQQDRWSDGGSHGLVAGVSHDGGATWSKSWPAFSNCAGGTAANGGGYERSSDPWVSFAPDGTLHAISISFDRSTAHNAVLTSRSTDGGDTWSPPTVLREDNSRSGPNANLFNDKESITADPTSASNVYAVWDRSRFPSDNANFNALHSFAFRGDIIFSRTTNGGVSWSAARDILDQNKNEFTVGNQIVVLPNGTLVDIFNLGKGSGIQPSNQFFQAVVRSRDKGVTWSRPIVISKDMSVGVRDPDTGTPLRTGAGLPEIAVDPNGGNLYAVWEDARFGSGDHNDIAFSQSTDGGLTWSSPVKVNQTTNGAAAFTPSVHVTEDGTVGVSYYDLRNNTPAAGLPTDYWIVRCHSACTDGSNWSETHVAGSFDEETAPLAGGYFLGDYEGLTSIGNTFVPFFVQTNSGNTANRTDVFAAAGP